MSIGKNTLVRQSALGALVALGAIAVPSLAQAEGDAANGEKVFRKCATCHTVGENARNKVGPVLTGVLGRQAGTYEDFRYGDSIVAAGEAGLVWSEDEIFTYLENPRGFLSDKLGDSKARSKMAFRLRKEDDRRDVIAYLATFSEPAETEEAAAEIEAGADAAVDVAADAESKAGDMMDAAADTAKAAMEDASGMQ